MDGLVSILLFIYSLHRNQTRSIQSKK